MLNCFFYFKVGREKRRGSRRPGELIRPAATPESMGAMTRVSLSELLSNIWGGVFARGLKVGHV